MLPSTPPFCSPISWLTSGTIAALVGILCIDGARAQPLPAPGKWAYTVQTDHKNIPAAMRDNFPTVRYERCLAARDIESPRAFGLQASPAMASRCSTEEFVMSGGALTYRFQCDGGTTLTGEAQGHYSRDRVSLRVRSRPRPIVRDIDTLDQIITAKRLGPCTPSAQ